MTTAPRGGHVDGWDRGWPGVSWAWSEAEVSGLQGSTGRALGPPEGEGCVFMCVGRYKAAGEALVQN